MQLGSIRPSDVTAYKTAALERLGGATVSRDLSMLHAIFAWAVVTEKADRNPTAGVRHPKAAQRKGNALRPEEMQALARAFDDDQDRLVFLTLVLTGLRRAELQALRWADVDLVENRLRVADSKTETGERSVALAPSLAEQLWQRRRATPYRADEHRVFCQPDAGTVYRYEWFAAALRRAYAAAGMTFPAGMRPFHDLRVTSITNDAIAGANPIALMTKAGHASMNTTLRYLRLAGTVFPDEAAALEARILGRPSTESSTRLSEPQPTSDEPASLSGAVNA
jgi:integrase